TRVRTVYRTAGAAVYGTPQRSDPRWRSCLGPGRPHEEAKTTVTPRLHSLSAKADSDLRREVSVPAAWRLNAAADSEPQATRIRSCSARLSAARRRSATPRSAARAGTARAPLPCAA